jgi:hypothetical protein
MRVTGDVHFHRPVVAVDRIKGMRELKFQGLDLLEELVLFVDDFQK